MIEYCDYCSEYVDLDYDVEHWSEEEYAKGRDKWKCKWEIEDDELFMVENRIKQKKETPPMPNIDPETGRDRI